MTVDKNAGLVNERNIQDLDSGGYFVRSGIMVVPKNGVVRPGAVA